MNQPAAPKQAVDLSNWSGAITAQQIANWRDNANVGAVFVQAVDPPSPYPPTQTQSQCQAVLDAGGVALHPYVFWWYGIGTDFLKRQLDLLTPFTGKIARLHDDVEDTTGGTVAAVPGWAAVDAMPSEARLRIQRQWRPDNLMRINTGLSAASRIDDLALWLEVSDQFPTLTGKSAIYAADWHWEPYMGNTWQFSKAGYGLWVAEYNNLQTLTDWTWFGGWSGAALAHQYAGTSTLLGVGNVDLNVIDPAEIVLADSPAPEPTPQPSTGSVADLQQALAYLADVSQKNADEVARVARQYGAIE